MSATDGSVDAQVAGGAGGLFPAYAATNASTTNCSLFPAYSAVSPEDRAGGKGVSLDWLENQSFGKNTAAVLGRLQQDEINKHQRHSSDDSSSEDSVLEQKDRKRRLNKNEDETEDEVRRAKKKKKKHKKHKKKKHKEDSQERADLHTEKEKFFKPELGKIFVEEVAGLTAGDAYRVDRSADQNNWTYGSLYKLHVAKYRRLGSSCMGLAEGQTVTWLSHSSKSDKKHRSRQERYYSKDIVRNIRTSESVPCCGTHDKKSSEANAISKDIPLSNFISLENMESRELYKVLNLSDKVNPLGVYDSSTCSYLQGKPTEAMAESMSADKVVTRPAVVSSENKTAAFNKALRENPNDIKLWLDFVKFQDLNSQIAAGSLEGSELDKLHSSSAKVTEKKLAILQKALKSNPASMELKMAELELSREVLEPEEVARQWNQLLFIHPGKTTLWLHYIQFVQSNLSQFTVAKTVKCYHTCLAKLASLVSGQIHLLDEDRPQEEDWLMVFYQYCCFLQQTSHTEKAVASLQALVEFNLFSPELVRGIPHSEKLTVFESFWDSGVARFGEGGAQGWAHWVQHRDVMPEMPVSQGDSEEAEEAILAKDQPVWKTWLEMETHREAIHWLPWRPDLNLNQTEEDCEDPDRLVLVDDVTPALFTFSRQELHFDLISVFLHFIGVGVQSVHNSKMWNHIETSQLFFQNLKDVSSSSTENINFSWDKSQRFAKNLTTFVQNVVQQSRSVSSDAETTKLTLLLLDFEVQNAEQNCDGKLTKSKAKELRKLAKSFLKEEQNRNNLLLWNWYAKFEHRLGNVEESGKVLETALSMQTGDALSEDSPCSEKVKLFNLYLTYVQMKLGISDSLKFTMGKRKTALSAEIVQCVTNVLDCLAEGEQFNITNITSKKTTPSSILKTKQKFADLQRNVVETLSSGTPGSGGEEQDLYGAVTFCVALYEHCTSGNIEGVSKHYEGQVSECDRQSSSCPLPGGNIWAELKRKLYIDWLRMVIFHQTRSVCPLSRLQAVLDAALGHFPEDRHLLQVFVEVETQSFITGRLRRFFDRVIKVSSTPYPAIFWSLAEIQRHLALTKARSEVSDPRLGGETGIVPRVRSLMERALQSYHSHSCVVLWRIYIHFEVEFGETGRAKGLFYRALQRCPWSKTLYKDAVSLFPEQLQELVDLMLEKEVRVQIPVEEIHILRGTEDGGGEGTAVEGELYAKLVRDVSDGN